MINRIGLILIILSAFYAIFIEPQWIYINAQDLRQDKKLNTIRIAHLADLHIQKIGRRELKVVEHVKALDPDLIVLSGDVIDKADRLPILNSFLSELGQIQAIAVLGNWEHWSGVSVQALYEQYQHHNVRLLVNDMASYQIRGRSIQFLGIDDFTAGQAENNLWQYSLESDIAILVQHSPGYFNNLPTADNLPSFDLCLAGHTHGGQVTLFGQPIWMPPGSGNFTSGKYHTEACDFFVSKGIGTSILPIRFWARPEIAVFDL